MIAIYGVGGFGREVLPLARAAAGAEVVFVSDLPEEIGRVVHGARVIAFDDLEARDEVVLALGSGAARRKLAERCAARGLRFASLVHPTHVRGDGVNVGEGAVFCAFTTCTADQRIGRHFQANLYAYVAHDCIVGDFVTLAPRASINGATVLEDDVYVGTGAVLKQGSPEKPLRIGQGAVIGMGAVVTGDVPAGATVVGNPARPLQRR